MTDQQFEFPALYDTASDLSAGSQKSYLLLVRLEYLFLFISAIFAMNFSRDPVYFACSAGVFLVCLGIFIARSWLKPEQDWYRGRALAESIKTSCWKYTMRAEPFGDADKVAVRRAEFRDYLKGILQANRHIGDKMPADKAARDQITKSMEDIRALPLNDRKQYYEIHRIRNQRTWYAKKAGWNKRASKWWVYFGIGAYAIAIVFSLLRIAVPHPDWWPIEPLIVIASSVLGWTQVKKFNELASSYTLTAHEIGIIQGRVQEVVSETEFSNFVNEAEQAFSREHTQWVARQQQP
ncbi:DUF4231 domain-containing protein [Rhizobium ruizarguesonis]